MNMSSETSGTARPVSFGLPVLLLAWFAVAWAVGVEGVFVNEASTFFAPIALSAVGPVAVFLAAYAVSNRFRAYVLSWDIRTLTMVQHWRVIGFAFLPLYFFGVLPGLFAWPAGLGDVAIGLAAVFVMARLDRDPDALTSRGLVRFHLLGLLDFIVAVVTAGLSSGAFPGLIAGATTSAPMDVWPLNLFPSFIVPVFIIMHLAVLLKVRHLRRLATGSVEGALHAA